MPIALYSMMLGRKAPGEVLNLTLQVLIKKKRLWSEEPNMPSNENVHMDSTFQGIPSSNK